jgi:hypothetical protein
MATENEKLIDVIVRLIKGTQEGRIPWTVEKTSNTVRYTAVYKGRWLRLYQDEYDYPNLQIIDDSGTTLWTFPQVSGMNDLWSSVRYQTADVKSLLDEIINDDELEPESREMSHSR